VPPCPVSASSVVGKREYDLAQLGSLDMFMTCGLAGWPLKITLPLIPEVAGAADIIGKQSRAVNAAKNACFGCM